LLTHLAAVEFKNQLILLFQVVQTFVSGYRPHPGSRFSKFRFICTLLLEEVADKVADKVTLIMLRELDNTV
jgi:hypothetical protein